MRCAYQQQYLLMLELQGEGVVSIRLRTVNGVRVALCAVEADPMPGDLYLDDGDHYALAAKFAQDWHGQVNTATYPEQWAAMATQKMRDAEEELQKWFDAGCPEWKGDPA